jgi:hypothetical protein
LVGMTMLEMVEPKNTARNHPRENRGMEQSWLCHYAALKHTCEAPLDRWRTASLPLSGQAEGRPNKNKTRREGRERKVAAFDRKSPPSSSFFGLEKK